MTLRGFVRALSLAMAATLAMTAAAAEESLTATVRPAAELFIRITQSAPATTVALQRTEVAARLAAPVDRFAVEVGERVDRSESLVLLECVDAEDARDAAAARLEEAEARAALAQVRLERVERLRNQDAAAADALDEARAEQRASSASVSAARAELVRARRNVDRCTVRAPATGVITARHADAGDYVQPGSPLLTLVAEADLEIRAHVTARDAEGLAAAEEVVFRDDDRVYRLEAPRRTGVIDPGTGTEEIRLRFVDEHPRPGLAGRVHWHSARHAVPAELLVRRAGQLGVFLARDGRAHFHPLPDAVEGRPAMTDLGPDARIVVEGRHAATNGTPLQIVE